MHEALPVYAYFNAAELAQLFDAVAALTNSGDFSGMLRLAALVGLVSVVLIHAMGRMADPQEALRWILTLALVQGLLLGPKVDVMVIDRTGGTPPQVRSNVPVGLAFPASASSSLGNGLTRAMEAVMALPDELQFQRRGLMFGNAVLVDTLQATPLSASFRDDLTRFIHHCTYYDLLSGRIGTDTFGQDGNLWQAMAATSQALLVPVSGTDKGSLPCDEAYRDLDRRWPRELDLALAARGMLLNPNAINRQVAKTLLASQIGSSYAELTGIAQDATTLLRQAITINAVRDSQMVAAQRLDSSSAAIVGAAQAQAELTANQQYLAMARVAERATPRMRNVIEIVTYAVFPVIVLLMLLSTARAGMLFKGYANTMIWLQLIPPLYAILNFVMTRSGRSNLVATASSQSDSPALALNNLGQLSQQGLSEMAMAGYLSLLLPLVAWAIVKGGEIGGNALFSAMIGPASGAAGQASTSLATGNISQNNVSLDTVSRNNLSANHYDSAPSLASGFTRIQTAAGTALYGNDGHFRFQGNQSVLGLSASFGEKLGNSIANEARESEDLAKRHTISASEQRASGIAERLNLVRSYGEHNGLHNASEIAQGSRTAHTLAEMNQIAENVNKRLGLAADSGAGREIVSSLTTGIAITPGMPMLSGKFGMSGDQIKNVSERKTLQGAIDYARNQLRSKGVTAEQAASDDFRDSEAYQWGRQHRIESVHAADESINKYRQYQRSAELARSDAESMSRQASVVSDSWQTASMQYEGYIASRLQQDGLLDHFTRLYQNNPDTAYKLAARYLRETDFDAFSSGRPLVNDPAALQAQTPEKWRSEEMRHQVFGEPQDKTSRQLSDRNRLIEGEPVVQQGHAIAQRVQQELLRSRGTIKTESKANQKDFAAAQQAARDTLARNQPGDPKPAPVPKKGGPGDQQEQLHQDLFNNKLPRKD